MSPRNLAPVAAAAFVLIAAAGCEVVDAPPSGSGSSSSATTADLDALKVAKAGSMRGYSREKFPHWRSAGANCDVRDTVLERDGEQVETDGCNVVGGSWTSLYDDKRIDDPGKVDIDHIVPLANAWRSGADAWDDEKRGEFANDLDRPQLVAASQASNRSKGDQDPSQWKPPAENHWCEYATDWVVVKTHWELTVTEAEKSALADMLETC